MALWAWQVTFATWDATDEQAAASGALVYSWCWADPVCLSAACAAAAAVVAMARRLDTIEEWAKGRKRAIQYVRHLVAGGVISGGASFGLCLGGAYTWPKHGVAVAAVVLIAAVFLDWSSDAGRKMLASLILTFMPAGLRDLLTRSTSSSEPKKETTSDEKSPK